MVDPKPAVALWLSREQKSGGYGDRPFWAGRFGIAQGGEWDIGGSGRHSRVTVVVEVERLWYKRMATNMPLALAGVHADLQGDCLNSWDSFVQTSS